MATQTISTADFKNGMGLKIGNKYYTIVEFQHVKPGKGGAFVRYKIKDLRDGRTIDQTCNAGTKFDSVQLITKEMQYLYNDGDFYYFMDLETYEQLPLTHEQVEDSIPFVKENTNVTVRFFKGAPFSVQAPNFVELTVTETDPGFAGDTAANTTKPATFETGLTLQVPLFINVGDVLKIDTRDGGEYLGRA